MRGGENAKDPADQACQYEGGNRYFPITSSEAVMMSLSGLSPQ
jgi:hypothetical protein